MTKYYAIPDLHGRYDLLTKAFEAIEKDPKKEYLIITLGDYIDRGPDSYSIIEFLQKKEGMNLICLKGNHEDLMVRALKDYTQQDLWIVNGGDTTLKSYGWSGNAYSPYALDVIPLMHLNWLENLPVYFESPKQVFVHAGIPNDSLPLADQNTDRMMWMLYDKNDCGGWEGKYVVHGHHQFADGPHTWSSRIDLDTGAYYSNRLVIGVFDDTQGPVKKFIEVRA